MKAKVECLKRFFEATGQDEAIKEFLIYEKLAKPSDFEGLRNKQEIAERFYILLREAEKKEEIILMYYEWQLLPKETIKITISTEREHREFFFDE